jgi:hypothetical protein
MQDATLTVGEFDRRVSQSDNRHVLLFADGVPSTKSEGYYESSKRIAGFYSHGAEI